MAKPFYGVDGNLLVDNLPFNHAHVEAILDGTFQAAVLGASVPTHHADGEVPATA